MIARWASSVRPGAPGNRAAGRLGRCIAAQRPQLIDLAGRQRLDAGQDDGAVAGGRVDVDAAGAAAAPGMGIALQTREMQQAQIDLRQNDTMRILTVVSTIFFPLSLIAGWYGMNFTHMPELSAPYAYFILIGVCILIVAVEIWYFKKKGWF